MKNKLLKIFILIITIILLFGNTQVFAKKTLKPYENVIAPDVEPNAPEADLNAPYKNPDFYEPNITNTSNNSFKTKVNKILGLISAVGTICSVAIVSIIGLRYMLGSVEEKAEYKKTMIGYLIGAFLLFSATTLPSILYTIGRNIGEEQIPGGGGGGGSFMEVMKE